MISIRPRLLQVRRASTSALPNTPYRVFDRYAKFLQRERASSKLAGEPSRRVDYLREEVADRLLERFQVRPKILSKTYCDAHKGS